MPRRGEMTWGEITLGECSGERYPEKISEWGGGDAQGRDTRGRYPSGGGRGEMPGGDAQ